MHMNRITQLWCEFHIYFCIFLSSSVNKSSHSFMSHYSIICFMYNCSIGSVESFFLRIVFFCFICAQQSKFVAPMSTLFFISTKIYWSSIYYVIGTCSFRQSVRLKPTNKRDQGEEKKTYPKNAIIFDVLISFQCSCVSRLIFQVNRYCYQQVCLTQPRKITENILSKNETTKRYDKESPGHE